MCLSGNNCMVTKDNPQHLLLAVSWRSCFLINSYSGVKCLIHSAFYWDFDRLHLAIFVCEETNLKTKYEIVKGHCISVDHVNMFHIVLSCCAESSALSQRSSLTSSEAWWSEPQLRQARRTPEGCACGSYSGRDVAVVVILKSEVSYIFIGPIRRSWANKLCYFGVNSVHTNCLKLIWMSCFQALSIL